MNQSTIDRVRVYRSGATVTRVLEVPQHVGVAEAHGFPLCLLDTSIQVRVIGAEVLAGAVQVGLHARSYGSVEEPPDEAALRAVRRAIAILEQRALGLASEAELLDEVDIPERPEMAEGQTPLASPMPARVALEMFTDRAIRKRLEQVQLIETELRQRRREEAALLDRVRRASLATTVDTRTLTKRLRIPLAGTATGPYRLEIDYFVPGARWAPSYQCHVDAANGTTRISQRAAVSQNTGEDWSQALLELSTALPLSQTHLPELAALRIGRAQPAPATRGFRPPPVGARALFADFDRGPRQPAPRHLQPLNWNSPPPMGAASFGHAADAFADEDDASELEESMPLGASLSMAQEQAAPSPPRARSAPAPKSMPAPVMAAPPPSPSRKKEKRRAESSLDDSVASEEVGVASFANLVLAPPTSHDRGRLIHQDTTSTYHASLSALGLVLQQDLGGLLRERAQAAHETAHVPLPSGMTDAGASAGIFDYTYSTDHRVDVPSDRGFHAIALGDRTTTASLTYVVVPRLDTNVFRLARIVNPLGSPMLPGPVEVYVQGRFVLSTQLPMVPPRAMFTLGLGVEQGVRCARNTTFEEKRSGQRAVAMTELHHTLKIELLNQLGRPIDAEVRERIPVPARDAEVDVVEAEVSPPWTAWDQTELGTAELEGGRRWILRVEPGQEVTLSAHYIVKLYANNELVGGNRREA